MPPTSSPGKPSAAEELATRKAAERERIAAGDIPDIVPPPLGKGKGPPDYSIFPRWIRSQPLCVADRPERAGMPYAIAILIGRHFQIYGLDHVLEWVNICDPPWDPGFVQKELDRARCLTRLEKQQQELGRRSYKSEAEYDISRAKYYDDEWFD